MALTKSQKSITDDNLYGHAVVHEAEIIGDKENAIEQDKPDQPLHNVSHRAYGTVWVMMAPFAIGTRVPYH